MENINETIYDICDSYRMVKTIVDMGKQVANEYQDMIDNMDTEAAKIYIDTIINDSYL